MGKRTESRVGTDEGVCTVLVDSQNPKTSDGWNTFIFRREVERSFRKLAWAPVVDARSNPLPEGVALGDKSVRYADGEKRIVFDFVTRQAKLQHADIRNDDFGEVGIGKVFVQEVQCHAVSTRREVQAVSSAREIALRMVHFVALPNEEIRRKKPNKYFEYGFAKVLMHDGLYLAMGEVGVRVTKRPYYDQRIVAKFKADSEVTSLHGQSRIGESAFDEIYDSRFRLILQAVDRYYGQRRSPRTVLVTGGAGFVARHLRRELMKANRRVVLTDVMETQLPDCRRVDLTDRDAVRGLVAEVRPEAVVHLGAISFVPDAAKDLGLLERVNVGGTENLLRAMVEVGIPRREHDLPTFLFVSTAQVLNAPLSAYAKSKLSAEAVVRHYCQKGVDAVIARPANHTGPGQSPKFVVPSFVEQAKEIKRGRREKFIVGNLESVRDFTDVRDVVRAYRLLLEKGEAGRVYVIGSNSRLKIGKLLQLVAVQVGVSSAADVDANLWRPTDASPILDITSMEALGWSAEIPIEQTLRDMVDLSGVTMGLRWGGGCGGPR